MKKFLKDDLREVGHASREILEFLKIAPQDIDKALKEDLAVVHFYSDDNYSVQIVINLGNAYENNGYLVFVFNKSDDLIFSTSIGSLTKYPPVWNREFGYIDYTDFLNIQKKINNILKENKKPLIKYDFSLENRAFYFTKETPEEIAKCIKDIKPYSIISIFAWKKPELAEFSHKLIGIYPET